MATEYFEKSIEGIPGYLIYFDDVRVDQYVRSFSTNISCDGSMGTANLDMIYIPSFYRDDKGNDGIENMTNLRIFIKNMFNDKYVMVFEGNIKGKSLTKSGSGFSLSFSAVDYMTWLNKVAVPISLSEVANVSAGAKLQWKARGIDVNSVSKIIPRGAAEFKGKTLAQYIDMMIEITTRLNKIFSDANTVAVWDNVIDRLHLMGDISSSLIQSQVMDFVITSSVTSVNSMYVGLNDIAKNLLFEFYQDRDGIIRIKPPFWNQKILYDHIIDSSLIMSFNENTNWNNYITRIIIQGGINDDLSNTPGFDELQASMLTPTGCYIGGQNPLWTDWQHDGTGSTTPLDTTTQAILTSGNEWLDHWGISDAWNKYRPPGTDTNPSSVGRYHGGIDYKLPQNTPIQHVGPPGIITHFEDTGGGGYTIQVNHNAVMMEDGQTDSRYVGYRTVYCHCSNNSYLPIGTYVKAGDIIGFSGGDPSVKGAGNTTGAHLHLGVFNDLKSWEERDEAGNKTGKSRNDINPLVFFRGYYGKVVSVPEITTIGNDNLFYPSPEERKYGLSTYDIVQPLIKFQNTLNGSMNLTAGKEALHAYSQYMYGILNSNVSSIQVQTVAMPWIRPGFNVWVDPIVVDKIYYVHSVNHNGSAEAGVYTSLVLTLGRTRSGFVTNKYAVGSMSSGADNIFLSQLHQNSSNFGQVIDSAGEFDDLKSSFDKFYSQKTPQIIKANAHPHFERLYGATNKDTKIAQKTQSSIINEKPNYKYNFDSWPIPMDISTQSGYVQELQHALSELGYYKSKCYTDNFNGDTQNAVMSFQSNKNLSTSGIVDRYVMEEIKSNVANEPIIVNQTGVEKKIEVNTFGVDASKFMGDYYTAQEIDDKLKSIYTSAPDVIRTRKNNIVSRVAEANDYLKQHYVSTKG